jgi:WD40 repeat protein
LIGIGSFRNKVAIFQESGGAWKEIAYHELHKASVNWVEFAAYGVKLFAGSSDGQISIL